MQEAKEVKPVIDESWMQILKDEFRADYFSQLKAFLLDEKRKNIIYPPGSRIFAAFNHTPFYKVKVVILGQDPYHGPGQANGLCFSVNHGIRKPPSLVNIFKELKNDLGIAIPVSGNLEPWAKQGVLLLNATLTVRSGQPGSHQGQGWERFSDAAISALSEHRDNIVFFLWGSHAQAKASLIDDTKHYILKAPHPSPLSASRGFFGCSHFSLANEMLSQRGLDEINWRIE